MHELALRLDHYVTLNSFIRLGLSESTHHPDFEMAVLAKISIPAFPLHSRVANRSCWVTDEYLCTLPGLYVDIYWRVGDADFRESLLPSRPPQVEV